MPGTDTWTNTNKAFPGAGSADYARAAFSMGNYGYVGTGVNFAGSSDYNLFYQFDASTETWGSNIGFSPWSGLFRATGFSIANKGYIYGGLSRVNAYQINPQLWEFTSTNSTKVIATQALSSNTLCQNATSTITYSVNSDFTAGNVFTAQLSDANGVFNNPTTIGTVTSTTNGTISVTIPYTITAGTGYRIRVVGSSPVTLGYDNDADLTVSVPSAPVITASAATLCSGSPVTLTVASGNTWTQQTNFGGTARESAFGFGIGNKGYIGGGELTADFWEFDPAANTWTQKANFPEVIELAIGFSIGNLGYAGIGMLNSGPTNKFYCYNPITNAWTQKANFGGAARGAAVGFSIGKKGYVGTGLSYYTIPNEMKDFWEYNPDTDAWLQKANFPIIKSNAVGFSIAGMGYIGTGTDISSSYGNYSAKFYQYNPNTDTWTQKADFGGDARKLAIGFSIGNKGYLGTGTSRDQNALTDFWEYNPVTDVWIAKSSTIGRQFAVGFSIGKNGYIGTGNKISMISQNDFWQYTPETTISWDNGVVNGVAFTPTATNTYTATATDVYGCSAGATVVVTVNALPTAPISGNTSFCAGGSTVLTSNATAGSGTISSYQWKVGGVNVASAGTSATYTATAAGSYTVTVTNSNGCSFTSSAYVVSVNALPTITASATATAVCQSTSAQNTSLAYIATTNTPTTYSISWTATPTNSFVAVTDAALTTSPISVTVPSNTAAGTYTGTLTVKNANGCVSNGTSFTVTVNALPTAPTITAGGATTFCSGGSVVLTASAGTTYLWSNNATTQAITVTTAGSYTVRVTNANACQSAASAATVVTVNALPTAPIITSSVTTLCTGSPVTLTAAAFGNNWTQQTNFGGAGRQGSFGFSIGNKGYIGTGGGASDLADFWEFDPVANSWTQKANFPQFRAYAVGFSIGNFGYAGLGSEGGSKMKDFYCYDPATNTWTKKADFGGAARASAVGFSIGSKGYVGTGTNYSNPQMSDFWEYNPSTDTWLQKSNLPVVKNAAVGFSIAGMGYIGTGEGRNPLDIFERYSKTFYQYNPATDTWIQKADFGGEGRLFAIGFGIDNKGYLGTGDGIIGMIADFWEYNPATDVWIAKSSTLSRQSAVGFSIAGNGYIGVGENQSNIAQNDFWQYTPSPTITWDNGVVNGVAFTPVATTTYTATATNFYGCTASANVVVAVNALPTAPISGNTSFCTGGSTVLSSNATAGSGTISSYQWKVGGFNVASAGTSATYTATAAGSYTVTVTNSNGCSFTSSAYVVTVSPASVGGTISGSASVCTGTNSTALTLSGHTGSITKWQSSTSSTFASAVTDVANTTTSLTATNLTATSYYKAVITSGACAAANSTTATVTVSPSLTASVSIVSNNAAFPNPLTFTATPVNGGSAPVYQWYDGSTAVGTNSSTYTTPTLSMGQTLNIYVVMTSNATPCLTGSPATSNTLTINTPLPILPLTGLKLNGYATATANLLNWYAYNEREMNDYTIERSLDGLYFNTIGNQPAIVSANGNNSYNYTDNNPLNGLNYYRIKGNSNNGQIQFSNITTIRFGSKQPTLLVAPNPVEYHLLNLKVVQLKKGVYTLKISDVLGRLISKRLLLYDGVSSTIKTSLPQTIKSGVYYVKLIGEGSEFTEKFIIHNS